VFLISAAKEYKIKALSFKNSKLHSRRYFTDLIIDVNKLLQGDVAKWKK